jgi:hypothetical protein
LNGYEFVYKQITPASLPSWKTTSAVEVGARIESETSYTRQDENQTVIEREDVIEGFSFGTTLVPFSGIFGVYGTQGSPQHGASSGCGWRNGLQLWKSRGQTTRGGPPAWG